MFAFRVFNNRLKGSLETTLDFKEVIAKGVELFEIIMRISWLVRRAAFIPGTIILLLIYLKLVKY